MHNIDRTLGETNYGFGNETFEFEEEFEFENDEFEFENEYEFESGGGMDESLEMEMASQLLSVNSDAELEYFLGGLFKKAVGGIKNFAKSSAGKALGGMLKGVAKKALPIAGAAIGNFVAPGIGGAIGGKLAGMAGKAFGLELEGLSAEDQEFEVARAYVRLASDAAKKTARSANQARQPQLAARTSLIDAARKHAPGLLNSSSSTHYGKTNQRSGRWVRKGNSVIIYGI